MVNPDNGIRGILFDLDGVLVNGPEWHEEAFNQTLEFLGMRPFKLKKYEIMLKSTKYLRIAKIPLKV